MEAISASDLIGIWERERAASPSRQALGLLVAVLPGKSAEELGHLSVGERNALLLDLRERLFGPEVIGEASCSVCGEPLECRFTCQDIRARHIPHQDSPQTVLLSDYEVQFRLPSVGDLSMAESMHEPSAARNFLLERCVMHARRDGESVGLTSMPSEAVTALMDQMSECDPLANMDVLVACPRCEHRQSVPFDIVSFLWTEVSSWVQRTLREVHLLASSYGWSEQDILTMTEARRHLYVELTIP